jgi:hypothetical protein
MGVKSCSKRDCESIMCDTYVGGVGYVCQDCQDEFIIYASAIQSFNSEEIPYYLEMFMRIPKTHVNWNEVGDTIKDYFKQHTD